MGESEQGTCVLCGQGCQRQPAFMTAWVSYTNCPTCGRYSIKREVEEDSVGRMDTLTKMRISACAREWTIRMPYTLRICGDELPPNAPEGTRTLKQALGLFPMRAQDRFDRALLNLCEMTQTLGDAVPYDRNKDYTIVMAETSAAGMFTVRELQAQNLIALDEHLTVASITVLGSGLLRAAQLEDVLGREKSKQAFVAMWFDTSMQNAYDDAIAPAIKDCGFDPLRVDLKETNQDVVDEIMAETRRSKFAVGDFTGQRGGVYFEAGFAMGLGLPVIWICRQDDMENAHFDTEHFSHIAWVDPNDLRRRLTNRIRATIPGAKLTV